MAMHSAEIHRPDRYIRQFIRRNARNIKRGDLLRSAFSTGQLCRHRNRAFDPAVKVQSIAVDTAGIELLALLRATRNASDR
jgi:hypothetical protein